ncbi:MAG: MATE family efflux transporter [[Clostridium] innocuum]
MEVFCEKRRFVMQTIEQNKMGYKPVLPLLMSMAFPPMLSMLIQSLYNIVDSMFVAQIGEDALTAVSLAFPIQTLIVACSVGIGVGVNSYIARKAWRAKSEGSKQRCGPWSAAVADRISAVCRNRQLYDSSVF